MHYTASNPNRKSNEHLGQIASRKSVDVRLDLNLGFENPICCYEACRQLGVEVRFVGISMEGFYQPGAPPRVHLSALRPMARKHFTCAHELGHHVFKHGATLDELRAEADFQKKPENERLVDLFAGHLLMPAIGMTNAFSRRGVSADQANANTFHAVANEFGVGFETLTTHLAFSLKRISAQKKRQLDRERPRLRAQVAPGPFTKGLALLDEHTFNKHVSLEIGQCLIVPAGTSVSEKYFQMLGSIDIGDVYGVKQQGKCTITMPNSHDIQTRISRYQYVGLAKFQHLEQADD